MRHSQKKPTLVSKETYTSVKRDLEITQEIDAPRSRQGECQVRAAHHSHAACTSTQAHTHEHTRTHGMHAHQIKRDKQHENEE